MRSKMSLKKRLQGVYILLILILVAVGSAVYISYSAGILRREAAGQLEQSARQMAQQWEASSKPAFFVAEGLMANRLFVLSLDSLSLFDEEDRRESMFMHEAMLDLQQLVYQYGVGTGFLRVSAVNSRGDFFTSRSLPQPRKAQAREAFEKLGWQSLESERVVAGIVLPPYVDPWQTEGEPLKVYGILRGIRGVRGITAYVEVQNSAGDLAKIFLPASKADHVVALTADDQLLFDNRAADVSPELLKKYAGLTGQSGIWEEEDPLGRTKMLMTVREGYGGVKILLMREIATIYEPIYVMAQVILIIGLAILGISGIYIHVSAQKLLGPLSELRENMERTELENLPEELRLQNPSNDEIEALDRSFQRLRLRLLEAVDKELKAHALQMRSNFDCLQAQVNPHMIYNILNVISGRAMEDGDDGICEICSRLAAMLRYSTSTLDRASTVGREADHVCDYLALMKMRYEDGLSYEIRIPDRVAKEPIPKMVLQPLVENCISHAFEDGTSEKTISVLGREDGDWWEIAITDNGQGFSPRAQAYVEKRIGEVGEKLKKTGENPAFEVGGMGLCNTFARLWLFYDWQVQTSFGNRPEGGAWVLIRAKKAAAQKTGKEARDDLSGADSGG